MTETKTAYSVAQRVTQLPEPQQRQCQDCQRDFMAQFQAQRICPVCVAARKAADAERERKQRLDWLGLALKQAEMTFEAFDPDKQPRAHAAAIRLARDWPRAKSLALLGPPGLGKTHLATAILLALEQRDVIGRYVHLPRLLARIRMAEDMRAAERSLLAPLWRVPVLVLDDAGREVETEHWRQGLDTLIDARWLDELPTVITANLSAEGFEQWLGPASASRFFSTAVIVEMAGADQRMGA